MTTAYTIKVDEAALSDAISTFEFIGGNTADALRIAINKTAPKIRTLASSTIRSQVRLSASYVGERLVLRKATRARLSGAIGTPTRGLLLSRFSTDSLIASDKASWIRPPLVPKSGIKVKVKPDGAAKTVAGINGNKPFYITLNGGKQLGIAARQSGYRKDIKVFSGPSLSQVFDTVRGDVLPQAGTEFTAQLVDAMRYVLVKKYPPEPIE